MDAASVEKVLGTFKTTLSSFAEKHRQKIKDDASFRSAFAEMCYAAGVDPLRSNKGFWSGLGLGDFYYELGVKVVGVCAATREENGGLIALDDLLDRLDDDQVSTDDIKWAVSKLKVLGDGFRVVGDAVVSVPAELSDDSAVALDVATADGSISMEDLAKRLPGGDPTLRATTALAQLKDAGFAWVDGVDGKVYLPSLWLDARAKGAGPRVILAPGGSSAPTPPRRNATRTSCRGPSRAHRHQWARVRQARGDGAGLPRADRHPLLGHAPAVRLHEGHLRDLRGDLLAADVDRQLGAVLAEGSFNVAHGDGRVEAGRDRAARDLCGNQPVVRLSWEFAFRHLGAAAFDFLTGGDRADLRTHQHVRRCRRPAAPASCGP